MDEEIDIEKLALGNRKFSPGITRYYNAVLCIYCGKIWTNGVVHCFFKKPLKGTHIHKSLCEFFVLSNKPHTNMHIV